VVTSALAIHNPKVLVVLVNTKLSTPASSFLSSTSVPAMFVSMNACRLLQPTWGLCRLAACRTAPTPCRHAWATFRSAIDRYRRILRRYRPG
jgi:hypothetical protein